MNTKPSIQELAKITAVDSKFTDANGNEYTVTGRRTIARTGTIRVAVENASGLETVFNYPAASGKTYTVSEYRKNGELQDTEYAFSDGDKWKVYAPGVITRNRSIKRQEHEGAEYRRAPLATLTGMLKGAEQVGETEIVEWNDFINNTEPIDGGTIRTARPTVTLDAATHRSLIDGTATVESFDHRIETPSDPVRSRPISSDHIEFDVTIIEDNDDRLTARIKSTGLRPDNATARRLMLGTLTNRIADRAISGDLTGVKPRKYFPTAILAEDLLAMAPAGVSDRIYTLDTADGIHNGIIKHADGILEVKIAPSRSERAEAFEADVLVASAKLTERHLPAPAPETPPSPEFPITPAGKTVADVPFFDRSIKVVFKCPEHPEEVYMSKDPYSSSWFPANNETHGCPKECKTATRDHILVSDYRPTRRG